MHVNTGHFCSILSGAIFILLHNRIS